MAASAGSIAPFTTIADFMSSSRAGAEAVLAPGSSDTREVVICLGNEAADLDSICSAVVLALGCRLGVLNRYLPEEKKFSSDFIALPALSIPADDFALRQDAVSLFQEVGLSEDSLLFLPSFSKDALSKLAQASRLKLVLTDHNKLAGNLEYLSGAVVGVIDHHEDTGVHKGVPYYNVVPQCGSACTLVAQLISQLSNGALLDSAEVRLLLSAPILLDTGSLAGPKTSELDLQYAQKLGLIETGTDKQVTSSASALHARLMERRNSINALTSAQRLRKDYKQWASNGIVYGISTVPCSLLEWSQSLPDFQDDFAAFADAHHLSLLLVMLTFTDNTKAFNRQLVIYASDALLMQDCSVFLATSSFPSFQQLGVDPSLDLNKQDILESTPLFKGSRCIAWQQRNLKASRKQLQPAVEAFLQSKRA